MPRTIAHRELRNNSSQVLRDVQQGETVEITNHGVVVAVLSPPASGTRERCAKPATAHGGFSDLPLTRSKRPSQQVLDELREER